MGLFFNTPPKNTSSGLGFDHIKYRQIGRGDGELILKTLRPQDRAKLTPLLKSLGTNRKSLSAISQAIKGQHGLMLRDKFKKAAEKRFNPSGLTAAQIKRNLRGNMQKDESGLEPVLKARNVGIFSVSKNNNATLAKKVTSGFVNGNQNVGFAGSQGRGMSSPSNSISQVKK